MLQASFANSATSAVVDVTTSNPKVDNSFSPSARESPSAAPSICGKTFNSASATPSAVRSGAKYSEISLRPRSVASLFNELVVPIATVDLKKTVDCLGTNLKISVKASTMTLFVELEPVGFGVPMQTK